ncbi:hypothetical protein AB8P60_20240, partial [Yersinia proxima]
YEELPNWIDDCICGSLGQSQPGADLAPFRFFRALQALDEIDTLLLAFKIASQSCLYPCISDKVIYKVVTCLSII